MAIYQERGLGRHLPCHHHNLGPIASRTVRAKFLFFKLRHWWYLVMTASQSNTLSFTPCWIWVTSLLLSIILGAPESPHSRRHPVSLEEGKTRAPVAVAGGRYSSD